VRDDPSLLLAFIQECVRQGRFVFTEHALNHHPPKEGFTAGQSLEAIMNGEIIEHREVDCRCLITGRAEGLAVSRDFVSTYIHCSVQYDRVMEVVIITMYRPSSDQWINGHQRRR